MSSIASRPAQDETSGRSLSFANRPWLYAIAFWTLAALLAAVRPTIATIDADPATQTVASTAAADPRH